MPRRQKGKDSAIEASLLRSFHEYGGTMLHKSHVVFYKKVLQQAIAQSRYHDNLTIISIPCSRDTIPEDREKAIETVFVADLQLYLDEVEYERRSFYVYDMLAKELKHGDNPLRILNWPPYLFWNDSNKRSTKKEFYGFDAPKLNPFYRFILKKNKSVPSKLALEQCDEGWLNGYAFEAIVASHAVWSQECYCCGAESLQWCGGSESSWRDLFCLTCQSCYEIKSKVDMSAIDKVFKFNDFIAGSYRRWCDEEFSQRRHGADYLVLVSRKQSLGKWPVEIAEIVTALPTLHDESFTDEHNPEVSLKTRLTLTKRARWFEIPGKLPDTSEIFRRAFQQVFLQQEIGWNAEEDSDHSSTSKINERCQDEIPGGLAPERTPIKTVPRPTIDDILSNFDLMAVGDDWEDLDL